MINPSKPKGKGFAVVQHADGRITFAGFGQTRRTDRLPLRRIPLSEIKRIIEWMEDIDRALQIRIQATRGELLRELYRRAEYAPDEVPTIKDL